MLLAEDFCVSLKLDLAKMGIEVCRMECRGNYVEVWISNGS